MHIDKSPSRIPTRLLLESGLNLVEIDKLQGTITPDNQVNIQIWNALHHSLYTANVDVKQQFQSFDDIQTVIAQYPEEQIQLPILRVRYNTLKPMALEYRWFKLGYEQLYDTSEGLKANPFDTGETFAVAPTQGEAKAGIAEFVFRQGLIVNNTGLNIINIAADFDDGQGKKPYNLDDPINITWTFSGTKKLKYFIYFDDGSVMEGHSIFEVTVPPIMPNGKYTDLTPDATVNASGYTLQIGFSDVNKANNPTVLPANLKIRKPFIVLDGIDQLNKADYKTFMFSTDFNGLAYRDDFKDSLAKQGYDLVYFNYADGGASIVTNADYFINAINYINAQKALAGSTEPNVVMGVSMGGLVARFGLAKMYRASLINPTPANNSQTRLLITHDSPHQGSNVPAAIHTLIRRSLNALPIWSLLIPQVRQANIWANSPAGKNMLNYSSSMLIPISGVSLFNPIIFTPNTFLANTYHRMVRFPAGGVPPPPYKFIATSQGSECGFGIVSPGQDLINSNGRVSHLIGLLVRAGVGYEFNVKAGNTGSSRVLYVNIYAEVRIFFGTIVIRRPLIMPLTQNDPYPGLVADSQPGSITDFYDVTKANINADWSFLGVFSLNASTTTAGGFCFVSRNSALDIISPVNYVGNLSGGNYNNNASANPSYANAFITQELIYTSIPSSGNIVHTTFTPRQTGWIFDEMQLKTPTKRANCAVNCDIFGLAPEINILSVGNYATLPNPLFTYFWSISGTGAVISAGQGTPSIIVTPLPGVYGTYVLTLTVSTNCSSVITTKTATFLPPPPPPPLPPPPSVVINTVKPYVYGVLCVPNNIEMGFGAVVSNINANQYPLQYNWTSAGGSITATIGDRIRWLIGPNPNSNGTTAIIRVSVLSSVATGSVLLANTSYTVTGIVQLNCRVVTPTPKNATINFIVSPNPSSENEITISQEVSKSETSASGEEQTQSEAKNEAFTLILYNKLQVKVRETTLNTLSKTISTGGLPNDVYFLHIISKDGVRVVKQVMILR